MRLLAAPKVEIEWSVITSLGSSEEEKNVMNRKYHPLTS